MPRSAIERYLREVEPIRQGVNALLGQADPILLALHEQRISSLEAMRRIAQLERHFAAYAAEIAKVDPKNSRLKALNAPYAHTYMLERAYLSGLALGVAHGSFADLPHTEPAQRMAIIRWREALTKFAQLTHAPLPADLRRAGRGEIAPSPDGSS